MAYFKRAIELFRTQVLGMPPDPNARRPDPADNVPASQRPRGYTQSLLERFQLPQGRWPSGNTAGAAGQDFYNFLSNAVNAAAAAAAAVSDAAAGSGSGSGTDAAGREAALTSASASASMGPAVGAFPGGDLSASGTLVPPGIRGDAEKMTFLAAQRERLSLVLGVLDREAAQLRSGAAGTTMAVGDVEGLQAQAQADRPMTSHSGRSTGGLSKSRSEVDFEKIEAESGAEDNSVPNTESARATPAASVSGVGGSWFPWGWSASSSSDVGKNKSE